MFVMRIIGLGSGEPTPFDGKYLKEYDPNRDGVDPDGKAMLAHVVVTENVSEAMKFANIHDVHKVWIMVDQRYPIRYDGEPNRPLTAFTVEIINE